MPVNPNRPPAPHRRGVLQDNQEPIRKVMEILIFTIVGNSLFQRGIWGTGFLANGSKGLFIEVFDFNGQSFRAIEKDFPKLKIPESVKKKRLEDFLKPFSTDHKKRIEKTFTFDFPEYFPLVQDFLVVGDKLYIWTYRTEEDQEEYINLDTKGNLLKTVFLLEAPPGSWTFYGNKFYYLKDSDEKEECELHCIDLQ